jgi:hypothetical protein
VDPKNDFCNKSGARIIRAKRKIQKIPNFGKNLVPTKSAGACVK